MIIVAVPPSETQPTLRIYRVVTVDASGARKTWRPERLRAEHPELFAR